MGKKKTAAAVRDDENPNPNPSSKSKKKGPVVDDDEYSIGIEPSEDQPSSDKQLPEDAAPAPAGKKKGKKGGGARVDDDELDKKAKTDLDAEEEDGDDAPSIVFSGKKKSKSTKSGGGLFTASAFAGLDEDNDVAAQDEEPSAKPDVDDDKEGNDDDAPVISFSGKKKKSSKSSKKGSGFGALLDDEDGGDAAPTTKLGSLESIDDVNEGDDDVPAISFSGKKKSSKSSKKGGGSVFSASGFDAAGLDEDDGAETATVSSSKLEDEDVGAVAAIAFTGKKKPSKSSKKSNNTVLSTSSFDEEANEPIEPPPGKDGKNETVGKEDVDAKGSKQANEDAMETSKKQKKKNKKSGRTAQEEDDLDKILAELGDGPPVAKPAPALPEEEVQVRPQTVSSVDATAEEKDGVAEAGESAAAKKKKKKKEKEKEKKAAAAAAAVVEAKEEKQEETKSKVSDKKVPKHVREMQEALVRRKEAEERKKKEEEERLRKEEEERRRLEELERLAEEAKRKKKEREKEKLLKKKQEGKLLTGKQKEEARRREAMRNQFLAQSGLLPASDSGSTTTTKRPIYQNKKTKCGPAQVNGGALAKAAEAVEASDSPQENAPEAEPSDVEKVEIESTDANEKVEPEQEVEENGVEEEEDDEEWDAKSWDNADLSLPVKSAFAEEDAEPVAKKDGESVTKKDIKRAPQPAPANSEAPPPTKLKPTSAPKKNVFSEPTKDIQVENENDEPEVENNKKKRKEAAPKQESQVAEASSKKSADDLRSPICCILGHVDTGKTKLLDCIRGTNVQEGEAGGITQQIGATYFPAENLRERTKELKADATLRVPGLLVIDTPGHESFTNLRSRGSGLCDIAILVVDIMHGLEPQTIESLNLLKMRNTEFIIALNKVDRLYGWKVCRNAPIRKSMKLQSEDVQNEFKWRLTQIITEFKEQGVNTELYYKNREMGQTFSIVPTSAVSGEGIPDLLLLLVQWTQKTMVEKLTFVNELQCTVLEVKVIEGLGTTIDVVLVNGMLHEGDQIVVCGMQGPIVTTIRALLTPHPMKELRVKGSYQHHKELKAAQGIKITAQGLEQAIAGTGLYVVAPEDDLEDVKEAAMQDMKSVMSRIDKSGEGVCVQASTLGSLEALLEFLKTPAVNIPVSGISIGPVHKRDVMRASVMLERKKEYATILAFDVKVTPEARELAEETGVKIFIADIIYHLFDQFKAYIDNLKEEKKKEAAEEAVFPCVLKIMPNCIFNKKDPIVLGVDVLEGIAKVGTPICIPSSDFIDIGRIASIEINHKQVDVAKKGQKVAIKIIGSSPEEQQKMFGRHFEIDDELVSHISRKSIDILKTNYRVKMADAALSFDDLSIEEWKLVVKLKNLFKIQ
ncbi:hypothetical protein ACLOJK_017164 [Asimina triloba]